MALRTPEFLQTKTYSAMRDRLVLQHGGPVQAGVWDAGDFKVTQRAAGANMSVDVAVGFALVSANDPGNAGLYHIQNDATFNATLQTNGTAWAVGNGTYPRIDRVVLLINDTTDGGDASDVPTIAVVQGTATAGATLDDPRGATAVPTGALLLADVLMPTSSTTVTTANIRDRRPWARGAFNIINYATNTTDATGTHAVISTLNPRIECSGAPLNVTLRASGASSVAGGYAVTSFRVDGATVDSITDHGSFQSATAGQQGFAGYTHTTIPAAGSHIIAATMRMAGGGTATVFGPMHFAVREDVRQNTNNT